MNRFSFNSLRSQLLLWIILPLLVVLLSFALANVQGHGQAMHEMVQTRADGLARAAAALTAMRVDRSQNELLRLASMPSLHHTELNLESSRTTLENGLDTFPNGLYLYQGEQLQIALGSAQELDESAVTALLDEISTTQTSSVLPVQVDDGWILLYSVAVPTASEDAQRVLIGVMPFDLLALPELIHSLGLDTPSELSLLDVEGRLLLSLQQGSDAEQMAAQNSVFASANVERLNWQIHLREGWTEWIPPVLRFGNMLLLVVLAAAALSVLSAYFGLQRIIQPLEQLHRAVNVLSTGDFDAVQKPVRGVEEIEELQQALGHMAQQIRHYQQELQGYLDAMTVGQEEERKRLARELHDETIQALVALNQQVEMVERRLEDDPTQALVRLRTLRPLISDAIAGIRRQIQNLRPLYLEDLGFISALEMLIQQTANHHDLMGSFEILGDSEYPLSPALEISGYRIVQEALKNVAAHAQATRVQVQLTYEPDAVTIRVEDDGKGFDPHAQSQFLAKEGHYGLLGMSERVRLHGGDFRVNSVPGSGTTVTAYLPTNVLEYNLS